MCGIIGFNWNEKRLIQSQLEILKHRGPDGSGIYSDKNVSLGHVRLSIIDLSKKGHQPMESFGYVISFNGEIYNYKELKKELKDYNFKSNSDTEVILAAYDKWGANCLNKFNGQFAFCIYDKKRKELFLARDRFGIKPLYFIKQRKEFIFGSEIKALLKFFDKKEIDKEALSQFFSFRFTLGEKTLVKNVLKFKPAHYLIYDLKASKIRRYSQYYYLKKQVIENKSFRFYKDKLRNLMEVAVKRRMVADVPVASLLSGGIDSSIITALAKKHNRNLNTFAIGFDTTNELPYASLVADKFDTNHYEFKLTKEEVLSHLDNMVYHMDEPVGDPGFLPIFVLSEQVSKYNKVVLSGDGGDEVFCGYDRYKMYHYGLRLRHLIFFDLSNDVLKRLKNMRGKDASRSFFEIIRLFDDKELQELGVEKSDAGSFWNENYKYQVTNAQEFDIKTLLPNDFFMKADKMSSAFGLEQRVPYLDHELVEFAFSIPLKYKLKLWNEKYILKESFRGTLPTEVINRRKHGFDVPIDYWFKNVLADKLKDLLAKNKHELYNPNYVYELLEKIQKRNNNAKMNFILAQKLWSILIFEMWYKQYIKNEKENTN